MGRERRSREEWATLVARWRSSGQTAAKFAEQHELSVHSLRGWSSRLGAEASEALNAAFLAVEVREVVKVAGEALTDRAMGVVRIGKARLDLDASADPRWVATLLHELAAC